MKIIIVLAVLVAMLYAETFKMETRSSGSLKARLMKANVYHKHLEKQHLRRTQVLKKRSQTLMDYYDVFYIGNVTIGTPGQTFSLMVDTGSPNLWVINASCDTYECDGALSPLYTRHKFDATKTSSLSSENTTLSILYDSGSWCSGPLLKDIISFADMTIEGQVFLDASDISDDYAFMPLDGILGLGWPHSVGQFPTPMQNLLPSLDAPLFTVWMDRMLDISMGGSGGLITYGAVDTTNCHPEISYVSLTSDTFWQFLVDGFSIGGYSEKRSGQAISGTGSWWLGVSSRVMDGIVNQTGAVFNTINDAYTVECSTMMTQPDLVFTINDIKYTVPSVEYVLDLGVDFGVCTLGIFEFQAGGFGPDWIFGATWIRTFCNIYDFGQKRIGFAKAIHSDI